MGEEGKWNEQCPSLPKMVNSITMNIDVREYLRVNPISVHELSLSSNDNDCFLFFPMENEPRGYIAVT